MKNFALVGNPNCGKTTLFNSLTGSSAHVGNWPGVTVDKREGTTKLGSQIVNIIDLPGIYSLSPYTEEEVISRNFIIDEKPDCLINVVDSTNLERNLYLTTQLMEIDVPIVVALNMTDVLQKSGDKIDIKKLSTELGLPVISISALKKNNLKQLIEEAINVSQKPREGTSVLFSSPLSHLMIDLKIAFHSLDVSNPTFHACKLAEYDELEIKNHPQLVHMVQHFKDENVDKSLTKDYEALIADCRYQYITTHFSPCLTKRIVSASENKSQDKIDKVLTHKIWGIPIFLAIIFIIFELVFSNNLFFLHGVIHTTSFDFIQSDSIWSGFRGLFWSSETGINSPGVILSNAVNGFTQLIVNSLRSVLPSGEWYTGFICEGILGGIFSVISFLPQILLLFGLFSILEDSGYMARIAFILDRIFKKFGLSGRAFLPMIMGFGCSVPAIVNTRTISNKEEKLATIRVIPFFACGAKLPILTAISACLVTSFGLPNPGIVTYSMYILGVIIAIFCVFIMRRTTLRGNNSEFIMELPAYHLPQFKSTMLLVWDKAKHFIKKAFTIILASTIVIWFISHFGAQNGTWNYVGDSMQNSILASIGQIIQPIFIPTGFGIGPYGWVFVVAIISGIVAKENVVAILATLSASILAVNQISYSGNSIQAFVAQLSNSNSIIFNSFFHSYGIAILLSFIAFNLFTIPCVATLASAKAETNKKEFSFTLLFWIVVSFIISSMIFTIGSFWWTSFIWAILIGLLIFFSILYNKKKSKKEAKLL